jgi:hypothetical protein
MYISDNAEPALLAIFPKLSEMTAVKPDDAAVEATGVEIVVQNKIDYPQPIFNTPAEEECATLASGISAAVTKPVQKPTPHPPGARKLMLGCKPPADSLCN